MRIRDRLVAGFTLVRAELGARHITGERTRSGHGERKAPMRQIYDGGR
jgi:hypothetical protein